MGDAFWERISTAPINRPNTTAASGVATVRSSERLITRLGAPLSMSGAPIQVEVAIQAWDL